MTTRAEGVLRIVGRAFARLDPADESGATVLFDPDLLTALPDPDARTRQLKLLCAWCDASQVAMVLPNGSDAAKSFSRAGFLPTPSGDLRREPTSTASRVIKRLLNLSYAENIVVFGSVARGDAKWSSDVDVFFDARIGGPRDISAFLAIARAYPGGFDPFVMTSRGLMVRNDDSTDFVLARRAKEIMKNIGAEGVPLSTALIDRLPPAGDEGPKPPSP